MVVILVGVVAVAGLGFYLFKSRKEQAAKSR